MNCGERETKQKRIILEELRSTKVHPTADEIYERVRRRLPHISLGTVYRNLELLAKKGEILKLVSSGSKMRFDGHTGDHLHISCIRCGKISDVRGSSACTDRYSEEISGTGYRLIDARIELSGICPDCQKREESVD